MEISFDSGASIIVSPYASHFISLEQNKSNSQVWGVSEEPIVKEVGILLFQLNVIVKNKNLLYTQNKSKVIFNCEIHMWWK